MALRSRIAYVYPGRRKCGLGFVILDDDLLRSMAIASVDQSIVGAMMERFKPNRLVIGPDHRTKNPSPVPVPGSVTAINYMRGRWFDRKVRFPNRGNYHRGAFVHNVWKMMYDDLFRQRKTKIRDWNLDELTYEWIDRQRPMRLRYD